MLAGHNTVHLSTNHQLGSHFFRFLGVHADCEHLENSIKRSWVEQALQNENLLFDRPLPPKMANQFMLHAYDRDQVYSIFALRPHCELLEDKYLISWLLLARMHVSGTVMHITISPLFHT